ncbi:tachylectin-related carbohydrate-binding protein [Actinoplanes sp. Pm04-4]|uniref:Tachylectin-related carbohydrate-binding protein n=1 Tax=Paractinoplanes pyxinae TaxID=2997416 RepID=A0ABT4BAP6_9ACTN|nr:tachylectin-related carbohydrate-binding protein [Actinoplanes pyxinae]MCY1143579.1 tachylectin-related carbohydrate-binding protein [Actinoplanes pyxinae]
MRLSALVPALMLTLGGGLVAGVAPQSPARADATCTGAVSVYGALDDGRLTYSAINPSNGNLSHVVVSTKNIGFKPVAMATLNFNTILVTDPDGVLHRIDVSTNKDSLQFTVSGRIEGGWTHKLLTYDGNGHLYGVTTGGQLLQYLVSRDKPGADQIGQRREIGSGGFTLKTVAAAADDRIISTTASGALISYAINSSGGYTRQELDDNGWQSFENLVSPGGGLYYGKNPDGALYWYEDDNPADGSGSDISYHLDDPVSSRGWTQYLLSAQPDTCKAVSSTNQLRSRIANLALGEVGTPESACDRYHSSCNGGQVAWCAMFATWAWEQAGISGLPRSQWFAQGLGKWGVDRGLFKSRSGSAQGSPKVGDWAIYGQPAATGGGHVDVVTAVHPDGTLTVVGGNVSNKVSKRTINPATARMGVDNVLISGYVTPPGA